jgi:pyruvate kinase
MRRHRHAKIVATIGSASSSPERLRELLLAGADVFRLNFSHGTHDDHRCGPRCHPRSSETGRPIAILQDLQGPKIRVGLIQDGKIGYGRRDRPFRA